MRTVGFLISSKENERRRALIPKDIKNIRYRSYVFIEEGYGEVLGFSNQDYMDAGVNVVPRKEAMKKDIIIDPKIGDANYISSLYGQTVFGWAHAVQNRELTSMMINNRITCYAWEDMFEKGKHTFWRNNEIAGVGAIYQAFLHYGKLPSECIVAIIGKGNVSIGAYQILSALGAKIEVYDRKTEDLLRKSIGKYDVIVNGVLWDLSREDHIISLNDLSNMKRKSMIIDISCDKNGAIESSVPTTIDDPIYYVDDVLHYVVDHTPALMYKSVSKSLSFICTRYIDELITNKIESEELEGSKIIKNGEIIDSKILEYQDR